MQDTLSKTAIGATIRPSLFNKKTALAGLFLLAIVWSILQTGLLQRDVINEGGLEITAKFLRALSNPDLSLDFLGLVWQAALTTLAYGVSATFISLIFGFFGGILASEVWWASTFPQRISRWQSSKARAPWVIIRAPLAVIRSIHEIIWGLFFIHHVLILGKLW